MVYSRFENGHNGKLIPDRPDHIWRSVTVNVAEMNPWLMDYFPKAPFLISLLHLSEWSHQWCPTLTLQHLVFAIYNLSFAIWITIWNGLYFTLQVISIRILTPLHLNSLGSSWCVGCYVIHQSSCIVSNWPHLLHCAFPTISWSSAVLYSCIYVHQGLHASTLFEHFCLLLYYSLGILWESRGQ